MEKRALFRSGWLPWLLIAPQMAVILVFFFWPASQAIVQSMQAEDAFGTSTSFVGLDNFVTLFEDPAYIESFKVTAIFSALVAVNRPCPPRPRLQSAPALPAGPSLLPYSQPPNPFGFHPRPQFLRRRRRGLDELGFQPLPHARLGQGVAHLVVDPGDDRGRRAGGWAGIF